MSKRALSIFLDYPDSPLIFLHCFELSPFIWYYLIIQKFEKFSNIATMALGPKIFIDICRTFLHCLSSNVSSYCLPEMMYNHIYCIRGCKVTLAAFVWLFQLCVFKCFLKTSAREDAYSHWLHLFGFSPLCIFKCVLKLPAREDA